MHNSYENVVRQLMGFLNLSPLNCLLEEKKCMKGWKFWTWDAVINQLFFFYKVYDVSDQIYAFSSYNVWNTL